MRDIFTKDFILKVLLPIFGTIILSAILYFAYSPFIVFLGLIVFSSLFFYSRYAYSYDKNFYEEYDQGEDTVYEEGESLFDKVMGMLPIKNNNYEEEDDYEDEYDDYEEEVIVEEPKPRKVRPRQAVRQENYDDFGVEPNPYDSMPEKQVIEVQVNNKVRRAPEPVEDMNYAPTRQVSTNQVNQAGAGATRQYARSAQVAANPQRRRAQPRPSQQPRQTTRQSGYSQQKTVRQAPRNQAQSTGYDDDYEFEYYPYDD